jgi:Chromo (CHRromatin Organisation MOdifier) domain
VTMAERQETAKILKEQLRRAHDRMKKYADSRRSERKFHTGDWVYLKLQPYRQVTVQGHASFHKLKPKYYGPFEIIERMGEVAYRLNLPPRSLIHPVFHVSQLKKCKGQVATAATPLPVLNPGGRVRIEPIVVLDRKIVKKKNEPKLKILVKWSNLEDEETTWEDYESICKQFPGFKLEDKLLLMGAVLSGTDTKEEQRGMLGAVGGLLEFKCGANVLFVENEPGFSKIANGEGPYKLELTVGVKAHDELSKECNTIAPQEIRGGVLEVS